MTLLDSELVDRPGLTWQFAGYWIVRRVGPDSDFARGKRSLNFGNNLKYPLLVNAQTVNCLARAFGDPTSRVT